MSPPERSDVCCSVCSVRLGLQGATVGWRAAGGLRSPGEDQVWQKDRSCWWPQDFLLGKLVCAGRFRDGPDGGSIVGTATEVPGNSASSSPSPVKRRPNWIPGP